MSSAGAQCHNEDRRNDQLQPRRDGRPCGKNRNRSAQRSAVRKSSCLHSWSPPSSVCLLYAAQTQQVWAIVVGFVLTVSLYVTFSAVIAVYTPELFPTKVRFRCVGVANAFAKLLTVLMPMIVGWMLTTMGSTSIFIAISVIAAIAAVVVAVFGTETGGKSVG